MHPTRWQTIQDTFHAALQRPPSERLAYLNEVCANDPELRAKVESLLDETAATREFMETPVDALSLAALELTSHATLEGRVLNHYEIGALIGSGGMADVYRARDTRLRRDVAIKVLHELEFISPEQLHRLYREARLLASLNHPNIASIYGIEEADGVCALVLELIEGESLSERLGRGALRIPEALDIAKQIAAGLQAAHAKGIIHRDLKPSNIKITPGGSIKIVDFGIAKLLSALESADNPTDISTRGLVIGTVAYMSPEQARGKPVDERTDVWAFGCVLYEMLTGRPAFEGDTPTDIVVKIATEEPDWSRITDPHLQGLIRKCLTKDPHRRYQTIDEIAKDLEHSAGRVRAPGEVPDGATTDDFVLPGRFAPTIFLFAQAGYLAIYGAAMYYIEPITKILTDDFFIPEAAAFFGTLVLAMCGIAVRLYLISAVGWHHPAARQKFAVLFPALLLLDGIWAASPLLLWRRIGYGLAFTSVALLAYVPFAQRTLVRSIYPKHSGKSA